MLFAAVVAHVVYYRRLPSEATEALEALVSFGLRGFVNSVADFWKISQLLSRGKRWEILVVIFEQKFVEKLVILNCEVDLSLSYSLIIMYREYSK